MNEDQSTGYGPGDGIVELDHRLRMRGPSTNIEKSASLSHSEMLCARPLLEVTSTSSTVVLPSPISG